MKGKLILLFVFLSSLAIAQIKLRSDNYFQVGYSTYTPLTLGNYTSQGVNNGTWAFEWWDNGLNIWKPFPSVNCGNYKLFIDDVTGNVGIGRRPSAGKLDVGGDIAINGVIKVSSDSRLKSEVTDLKDCLTKLNQLSGKSYFKTVAGQNDDKNKLSGGVNPIKDQTILNSANNKAENDKKKELGFIAQDIIKIFPELVDEDNTGTFYVDYIGLIPVIVEAIKEQKNIIDEQSLQIIALQDALKKAGALKSGTGTSKEDPSTTSENAALYQNIPNPFNYDTHINYFIPTKVKHAYLYVFNMNGNTIKSYEIQVRGKGETVVRAAELNAGLYYYSLIVDNYEVDTKRMILTN